MRRVTKENLSVQIDRLRKIKDEQGQLSMSSEYTLQAYEMLLATMEAEPDCNERQLFCSTDTSRMKKVISVSAGTEGTPLYRHAQPALVVEREPIAWLNDAYLARGVVDGEAGSEDAGPGYIPVYRHAQPAPAVQCPFPCGWDNLNKLAIQDAAFVARGLVEGEPTTEAQRQAAISNNDRLLKVISACRAAMLNQK
ncbi:DUF551 domain-containing protein [Klebsiella phage 1611E-K2-1]|uniref:DUF551 domain-containing protein, partial n=1 Tax=Klebsiella phage 1611E-K2-1 TaxID=2047786 RepID=UPI00233E8855|nr:DUF551 domain-containing protein [Klebsiella phage 1611E-K2-1]